jgi:hypothetical protein
MRLKVMVLACFTLLAFLAVLALAIDWENPEGLSADELLAQPEGYTSHTGTTPWQEREMLRNTSKNTSIFEPIPSTIAGGGDTPQQSRALAQSASQTQTQAEAPKASESTTAESTPSAKGSWSLHLLGQSPRDVSITLYQSGNAIFGKGDLSQGNTSSEAAASGSLSGNQMTLDIITLQSVALYRATLTLTGDKVAGSYQGFSVSGDTWTGDVSGSRTA